MLAIRNGTKAILRTPAKAALYCLIILLVASLVSVAFCVNSAVNGYLADCEEFYHTIATVEYIGEGYPNIYAYDEKLTETLQANKDFLEALLKDPSVMSFEPNTHEVTKWSASQWRRRSPPIQRTSILRKPTQTSTAPIPWSAVRWPG